MQSLLRIRIILELHRVDEAIRAFHVSSLEFGSKRRGNPAAILGLRQPARCRQIVKCERDDRMRVEL